MPTSFAIRPETPCAAVLLFLALAHCSDGTRSDAGIDAIDAVVRFDTGAADNGFAPPDAVDAPTPRRPRFDWVGIVGTGQSLSVGASGTPVLSTTQPFHNMKLLDMGTPPLYDGVGDALSLAPLVEPFRNSAPMLAYPNNIYGETPHSAMANQITALSMARDHQDYVTLHSAVGEGGQSITVIRKNGTGRAYAASLYEANAFRAMAMSAGRTFGYGAVILTHGETDAARDTYELDLLQLWADYNADLRAITGQTERIPLLVSQQSTFPNTMGSQSFSTLFQWRAGVDYPGDIICIGPKYQYQYSSDFVHLPAAGYRRLGIKYAQAYYQTVVEGRAFRPLQPRRAVRAGRVITLDWDIPVPPLNWDENIPPPHQTVFPQWANGRGFEVGDSTGGLAIASVAIVGDRVQITLAADPTGTGMVVEYAMISDANVFSGGPLLGRRGQLRDSDAFVGIDQQTTPCMVTNGSANVDVLAPAAFATIEARDVVTGTGLTAETIVLTQTAPSRLVLSRPWMGPTGMAPLTFHSDQHNYAVQFALVVQ